MPIRRAESMYRETDIRISKHLFNKFFVDSQVYSFTNLLAELLLLYPRFRACHGINKTAWHSQVINMHFKIRCILMGKS